MDVISSERVPIKLWTPVADVEAQALDQAERRGLERAAKVADQMRIQTCAIRNETAIIHELLLKIESRIEKVAKLEKQIHAQAQADKETK